MRSVLSEAPRRVREWRERIVAWRWARRALAEVDVPDRARERMAMTLGAEAWRLRGHDDAHVLAESLLAACRRLDSGAVQCKGGVKLRSYVDVSVQTKALRLFADYLAAQTTFGGDAMAVTA